MDTLIIIGTFFLDMARIWLPYFALIGALTVGGAFALKTMRTARSNAAIRAERARRDAWRAPVIPFPTRHTDHVA